MSCWVLVLVLVVGCGGGGEGGDDDVPFPSPQGSATTSSTPTLTPRPSTTPTPDLSFHEVVVGVATRYDAELPTGGVGSRPFVLRHESGRWDSVPLGLPVGAGVRGVTFASPQVAFAFGARNDATGVLVRTDNGGRTWRDLSLALPTGYPQVFDGAFSDERNGYLVGQTDLGPPVVIRTADGGSTWLPVAIPPPSEVPVRGTYAVGFRAGTPELVRYDGGGLVVVALDEPTEPPVVVQPPSDSGGFAGANSFSTAGSVGWIAQRGVTILRSGAPGGRWERVTEVAPSHIGLGAIDVRDDHAGVAGGVDPTAIGLPRPVLLATDDGATWQSATVEGMRFGGISDVLRLRGDDAIAALWVAGVSSAPRVLRSTDGGHTWRHEPMPFEGDWEIHDLARNTDRP